jgi:hypothetical protein
MTSAGRISGSEQMPVNLIAKRGILYVVVADGPEGSIMRGAVPDDARRPDLGTSVLTPRDLDQTDELIGIHPADLCPR